VFLPGSPVDLIRACYAAAPGNEIESGRFYSPRSSTVIAANAFGYFLFKPADLPPLPGGENWGWPSLSVRLEAELLFPWEKGNGIYPWVDALFETSTALIGIEIKRIEPFDPLKRERKDWSRKNWWHVWGNDMSGYERVCDDLRDNKAPFTRLDATQLVKHAFGLRTVVHRKERWRGKRPVLLYVYAESDLWQDGRPIPRANFETHRGEVSRFAETVAGDEVAFRACSYRELLLAWANSPSDSIRAHAVAITRHFSP
jgi:hypothetical protein